MISKHLTSRRFVSNSKSSGPVHTRGQRQSQTLVVLALHCVNSAAADQPYLRGLGQLQTEVRPFELTAISADGRIVTGYGETARGTEAFRWQIGEAIEVLGDLDGGPFHSRAYAISADGFTVVGVANHNLATGDGEAFRWTPAGGMVGLGFLDGDFTRNSYAYDVSSNGVVVGAANYNDIYSCCAFRWTADTGMVRLDDFDPSDCLMEAAAVSADGSKIVGWSGCPGGWFPPFPPPHCFQWTQAGGTRPLHEVPDYNHGVPRALTEDGSIVIGSFALGIWGVSIPVACRWDSSGEPQLIANLGSVASGVSSDGTFVVGSNYYDSDWKEAFLWDAIHGPRRLSTLLAAQGVSEAAQWTLFEPTGISADGRTIIGSGINPDGEPEPWIARLVWNGDVDGDFDVDLTDLASLLSCFALCDDDDGYLPAADADESGCVDLSDLAIVLNHFGS